MITQSPHPRPLEISIFPQLSHTLSLNLFTLIHHFPTMPILPYFLLLISFTTQTSATYCLCKDGVPDQTLQKALDYACGAGADCSPILQNGVCFQPNTVKDHCSYAANSYFQKKGQAQGTCDFAGAATVSQTAPSVSSSCVYPSSPSYTGTPTPTTTTPTTTTTPPTTPTTTASAPPPPPFTTTTTPSTTTPATTTPSPVFGTTGLGPTASGSITDSNHGLILYTDIVLPLWLLGVALVWY